MAYPAHTVTAILGNLFSSPATAVATLGPSEIFGAVVVLTAAVAGLVAIRSLGRPTPTLSVPATELEFREAA